MLLFKIIFTFFQSKFVSSQIMLYICLTQLNKDSRFKRKQTIRKNPQMQNVQNIAIPGITTKGSEFFVDEMGDLKLAHNISILPYDKAPKEIKEKFKAKMPVPSDCPVELESFIRNNYGILDGEADIDEEGNISNPDCGPNKKYCFPNGNEVSPAQLRVAMKLDLTPAQIAIELFISKKTVDRHIEDMVKSGQFLNTKQLVLWAGKIARII